MSFSWVGTLLSYRPAASSKVHIVSELVTRPMPVRCPMNKEAVHSTSTIWSSTENVTTHNQNVHAVTTRLREQQIWSHKQTYKLGFISRLTNGLPSPSKSSSPFILSIVKYDSKMRQLFFTILTLHQLSLLPFLSCGIFIETRVPFFLVVIVFFFPLCSIVFLVFNYDRHPLMFPNPIKPKIVEKPTKFN